MEKLPICQCHHLEPVQLHALGNVRDDLEDDSPPLTGQLLLTLACDLLADPLLPTRPWLSE